MVALARLLMESGVVLAEEGPVGGLESFEELAGDREGEGEERGTGRVKKVQNVCLLGAVRCIHCYLLLSLSHMFL